MRELVEGGYQSVDYPHWGLMGKSGVLDGNDHVS